MDKVKVFAPASIGNIGPGFDVLGMAINSIGDVVEAKKISSESVKITEINGNSKLPYDVDKNTAGIAAKNVLKKLKKKQGIELKIHKNMPSGSGLGSSAASAVAAGYAVNLLLGNKLSKYDLIKPCTEAEAVVSGGFFADNTATSLFGGATLTRSYKPLDIISLGTINNLIVVVVTPDFELLTKKARAVLPKKILMKDFISNMANSCAIVAAFAKNDVELLSKSVNDKVIEPARAKLIPGFYDVKNAALNNGALGCSISGAGPSVFAVTDNKIKAKKIGNGMKKAFSDNNIKSTIYISKIDEQGARKI